MEYINYLKKRFSVKKELVKVYSHPRSGTHFLETFIGRNFYKNKDLSTKEVKWGHWSNRMINYEGNHYGKLFGNHYLSDKNDNDTPKIYIIRDPRSVAYSVWKTSNFLNEDMSKLSFKDFLKEKIDWHGSPGIKTFPKYTIFEHWLLHTNSWIDLAKNSQNILIIKYEDLVRNPYDQYLKIHQYFFKNKKTLKERDVDFVSKPVGLLPNLAEIDSWKKIIKVDEFEDFYNVDLINVINKVYLGNNINENI